MNWEIVEHSWSDTGIYEDGKRIATLSIYDEATEETQGALEKEMAERARLIASAPNLLEALQMAAQSGGFQYMVDETRSVIETAIAKATGADAIESSLERVGGES